MAITTAQHPFRAGDECKLKEYDPQAKSYGGCIMVVVFDNMVVSKRPAVLCRFIDPHTGDDMASVVQVTRLVKMPAADWRIVFAQDTKDGIGTRQLGAVSYPYLSSARHALPTYGKQSLPIGFAIFPQMVAANADTD